MSQTEINPRTKKPYSEEVQRLHRKIEKCIQEYKDLYIRIVALFDALRRYLGITNLYSFMKDIFYLSNSLLSSYEKKNNKAVYCWISQNYDKVMPMIKTKLVSMIPNECPHGNVISQLYELLFKDLDQNKKYLTDIENVLCDVHDCLNGSRVEDIKRKYHLQDLNFNDVVIQKIEEENQNENENDDFLLNDEEYNE